MIKKIFSYIAVTFGVALLVSTSAFAADCIPRGLEAPENAAACASILPDSWCESNGVWEILNLVLNIATLGIGILATIGIVITGIMWLTARDNEQQVVKSKNRMFNIVIGIMVWGLLWLFLSWLIPGGVTNEGLDDFKTAESEEREICEPGEKPGSSSSSSSGTETNQVVGNANEASEAVACDPRTTDLGIHDGWSGGKRTYYRLCSIPNLPSTTTAGYAAVLQKAGRTDLSGKAVLNSRVSGAVYSMVEAAKADGVTLTAGSTFRSFEWQRDNCNLNQSQKNTLNAQRETGSVQRICNKDSSLMAPPGYSNHQSGTAIDFTGCNYSCPTKGPCNNAMYNWLRANATRFGFSQYVNEYWHYDTR
ncbi:MAG: D-alanyl-D-alanine carboxypeptidase family protein [Candidatus Saccharimonadales bacterium]